MIDFMLQPFPGQRSPRAPLLGLVLLFLGCAPDRMKSMPAVMLWAWERPEDLRSIDPTRMGVAYLCQTYTLRGDRALRSPRLQPLEIPPETRLLAVTRLEVDSRQAFHPTTELRETLVQGILANLRKGVRGIQVDFDAKVSERVFYADLLKELRQRLDPALPLSITALASWALGETWLDDLPVDEVVPMVFDMGSGGPVVKAALARRAEFRAKRARRALGVGLREPLPWMPQDRRIYVFSHQPWNAARVAHVRREVVR